MLFQSCIVLATRMFLHMFLLQLVLSHLDITILIQLVYCISIGQCTFFISYSGSLLFANTIFDFLHLIPCFSRMFLISAWLILSTFHVYNWIQFFVSMYNDTTFENYFINELNERGEYILN